MYFKNKRWGVVANEEIEAGQFITEYTGQRIDNVNGTDSKYLFDLDFTFTSNNTQIDAKNAANIARFFNNSCEGTANAKAFKVITSLMNSMKIGYFATRRIHKGEEITILYGKEFGLETCYCNYHLRARDEAAWK